MSKYRLLVSRENPPKRQEVPEGLGSGRRSRADIRLEGLLPLDLFRAPYLELLLHYTLGVGVFAAAKAAAMVVAGAAVDVVEIRAKRGGHGCLGGHIPADRSDAHLSTAAAGNSGIVGCRNAFHCFPN